MCLSCAWVTRLCRVPLFATCLLARNGGETRRPDREAVVQQVLPVCTTIWLCVVGYDCSGGGHLGRHPGLPLHIRLNGSLAGCVEGPLWDAGGGITGVLRPSDLSE